MNGYREIKQIISRTTKGSKSREMKNNFAFSFDSKTEILSFKSKYLKPNIQITNDEKSKIIITNVKSKKLLTYPKTEQNEHKELHKKNKSLLTEYNFSKLNNKMKNKRTKKLKLLEEFPSKSDDNLNSFKNTEVTNRLTPTQANTLNNLQSTNLCVATSEKDEIITELNDKIKFMEKKIKKLETCVSKLMINYNSDDKEVVICLSNSKRKNDSERKSKYKKEKLINSTLSQQKIGRGLILGASTLNSKEKNFHPNQVGLNPNSRLNNKLGFYSVLNSPNCSKKGSNTEIELSTNFSSKHFDKNNKEQFLKFNEIKKRTGTILENYYSNSNKLMNKLKSTSRSYVDPSITGLKF